MSILLTKKTLFHTTNYSFHRVDLEKITLSKMKRRLAPKKYDLIILFRFLHRPLFKIIPFLMKRNGFFFGETCIIQNGKDKLNTKKICY